jgi:tetratricopeptide (TPR) repeat protein
LSAASSRCCARGTGLGDFDDSPNRRSERRYRHGGAADFASRYADGAASSRRPPRPRGRDGRGAHARVVVVVPANAIDSGTIRAIAGLPRDAFAITLAVLGVPASSLPPDTFGLVLPAPPDAAAAKAIAAQDADVLIDLAGMEAAAGSLLAQRPARAIWTLSTLRVPHAAPLADRRFDDLKALIAALAALQSRATAPDARSTACTYHCGLIPSAHTRRATAPARSRLRECSNCPLAPAHYLSGIALRDSASTDARAAFAAALTAAPGYVDARIAAANAAVVEGDFGAAVALCDEGLATTPFDTGLLRALGRAHLARHDGAAAAAAFAQALNIDMTDGETHYNHGVALQMQRQFSEAARAYQRALLFRPDFFAAHFNLGVLFQEQRMTDAAIGLRRSARGGSRNVSAYKNLAKCCSLPAGSMLSSPTSRDSRALSHALPLAVQAPSRASIRVTSRSSTATLEGIRHDRFVLRSAGGTTDALEELSISCCTSMSSPRCSCTSRRSTTTPRAARTASRCRLRPSAARSAPPRLPSGDAQPRHGQDDGQRSSTTTGNASSSSYAGFRDR